MSEVLPTLRKLITRFSAVPEEQITLDTRFDRLGGWGSLAALQLLAAVESEYDVHLDLTEYLRLRTVGDLAGHLRDRRTDGAGR
ncbi:acyl carrier protein [Micromonospora sp. NPDC023956]|uniref:acyl carrier protein n=1 Tax=Micromonospora sp. NPDC023956 TaxID=3155722 RepID=UPI0033F193FD